VTVDAVAEAVALGTNQATVATLAVGLFGVFEHVTGSQQLVASSALQAELVVVFAESGYTLSEINVLSALGALGVTSSNFVHCVFVLLLLT
jgi:hypothetical protein